MTRIAVDSTHNTAWLNRSSVTGTLGATLRPVLHRLHRRNGHIASESRTLPDSVARTIECGVASPFSSDSLAASIARPDVRSTTRLCILWLPQTGRRLILDLAHPFEDLIDCQRRATKSSGASIPRRVHRRLPSPKYSSQADESTTFTRGHSRRASRWYPDRAVSRATPGQAERVPTHAAAVGDGLDLLTRDETPAHGCSWVGHLNLGEIVTSPSTDLLRHTQSLRYPIV